VTVDRGDEWGPPTRKGRETRQRIVDAAADLIYARGVAAASLDEVGRATGTSRSQLYHYFSGKNALVGAVIDRQRDRILAFQRPALESLATWEDITGWRDMIVAVQRELGCRGGCPLGSLANELASDWPTPSAAGSNSLLTGWRPWPGGANCDRTRTRRHWPSA